MESPTDNGDDESGLSSEPTNAAETGSQQHQTQLTTGPQQPEHELIMLEKLRAERDSAEYANRWYVRVLSHIPALTATTAAVVALIGIAVSVGQWNARQIIDADNTMRAQKNDRRDHDTAVVEKSIADLASATPQTLSSAVANLVPVFSCDAPAYHERILRIATRSMAVVDEEWSQVALNELIDSGIRSPTVSDRVKAATLDLLVNENRILTRKHNLWSMSPHSRETTTEVRLANGLATAIVSIVRSKEVPPPYDLSDTYCVGCDFSGCSMPKSNFDRAILHYSSFISSTLNESTFNGTYLDTATFESADLRDAHFGHSYWRAINRPEFKQYKDIAFGSYPVSQHTSLETITYWWTKFNCADLRRAEFSSRAIVALSENEMETLVLGFSFMGADLADATFEDSEVFGLKKSGTPLPFATRGAEVRSIGQEYEAYFLGTDESADEYFLDLYSDGVHYLAFSVAGSSWRSAKLPPVLRDLMTLADEQHGADVFESAIETADCIPRSHDVEMYRYLQAAPTKKQQSLSPRDTHNGHEMPERQCMYEL